MTFGPSWRPTATSATATKKQESGLRLDSGARLLAEGGNSGPAIVAGKSGESLLIQAVTGAEEVCENAPQGSRADAAEQIELLKRWIDEGAAAAGRCGTAAAARARAITGRFSRSVIRAVPEVSDNAWVRNPIDAFVLARLEAAGLRPSPEADKATLIRRVSLDLIGLPPTGG